MPAIASIVITVDEKGAVQAFNRLDAAGKQVKFDDVGTRGTKALKQVQDGSDRARDAVQLLSTAVGIQVPRSLEKVIAKAPAVGSALSAAFEVAVVAAFVTQLARLAGGLDDLRIGATKVVETFANAGGQIREVLTAITGHDFGGVNQLTQLQRYQRQLAITGPILQQIEQLEKQADAATLQGLAAIEQKRVEDRRDVERTYEAQIQAARQFYGTSTLAEGALEQLRVGKRQALLAADQNAAAQRIAFERGVADETTQIVEQATEAQLKGIALIDAQEAASLNALANAFNRGLVLKADFETRYGAIQSAAERRRLEFTRDLASQGNQAILQAEAAAAAGRDQIEAARVAKLQDITHRELQLSVDLSGERQALAIETNSRLAELDRQRLAELQDLESQTAIALLPPWKRADAQIVADAQKRVRDIETLMQRDKAFQAQGAQEIALIWAQTFAQMRDNLAGQLESLFDDITSGNIGKRFVDQFKKLVFEMIASWALGLRQMRTQTAGSFSGGGLLGALFSGVLGLGGIGGFGASGAQQVGPGGTAGIFSGLLGGGGSGGGLFGGGGLLGGLFGGSSASGASGGLASLPTALTGGQLSNLAGLGLSAGGGIGTGTVLPAGASAAIGGGRFAGLLAAGPGLALLGAGSLFGLAGKAGPFGGAALGALGGLLGTGGLIAAFPALLGVLGAATLGIGALIGGLIGFFGGLFGNSKRQRAVEQLGQQVKDQITQIENSYNTHQEDATSAISQLESLRTTAHAQMHKLGGDTRTRVEQPINAAESYINQTEAERARRAAIQFGPAEFHTGGLVRGGPAAIWGRPSFHTGGEINANLLIGEGVVNRRGMAVLGENGLNALNSGAGVNGDMHLHFHGPMDEAWLRNGGAVKVAKAINQAVREGRV